MILLYFLRIKRSYTKPKKIFLEIVIFPKLCPVNTPQVDLNEFYKKKKLTKLKNLKIFSLKTKREIFMKNKEIFSHHIHVKHSLNNIAPIRLLLVPKEG